MGLGKAVRACLLVAVLIGIAWLAGCCPVKAEEVRIKAEWKSTDLKGKETEHQSWGRGVAIDKKHVLTARHNVVNDDPDLENNTKYYVLVGKEWVEAKRIASDQETDLAIIEFAAEQKVDVHPPLRLPKLQLIGNARHEDSKRLEVTIEVFGGFIEDLSDRKVTEDDLPPNKDAGTFARVGAEVGEPNPYASLGVSGSPIVAEGRTIGIVSRCYAVGDKVRYIMAGPTAIQRIMDRVGLGPKEE